MKSGLIFLICLTMAACTSVRPGPEVFLAAERAIQLAEEAGCEELANCEFLQLSAVFNPEFAYSRSNVSLGLRTSEVVSAVTDHVHPNEQGYAQIADALFYNIIYRYCQ